MTRMFIVPLIWHTIRYLGPYQDLSGDRRHIIFLAVLWLVIGLGDLYLARCGWSLPTTTSQNIQHIPTFTLTNIGVISTIQNIWMVKVSGQPAIQSFVSSTSGVTATNIAQRDKSLYPVKQFTITLEDKLSSTAKQPSVQKKFDIDAAVKAIGKFLLAAVKSVWGIFYLLVFALSGYFWFRRYLGLIVVPMALLFAVGVAGGLSSSAQQVLTQFISSSPVGWMRGLLYFSVSQFGHAGWGILVLGIAVGLGLLPLAYLNAITAYHFGYLPINRQSYNPQAAYEYMIARGVHPIWELISLVINLVISLGLPIALWIALRQIAQAGELSLSAWGIPDLAVPNWKPVWNFRYFALIGVLLLIQIMLIKPKREFNLSIWLGGILGPLNLWVILGVNFIIALFVPAGVLLFLIGQALTQFLSVPIIGGGIAKLYAEELKQEAERLRRELEEEKKRSYELEEQKKRCEEELKRLAPTVAELLIAGAQLEEKQHREEEQRREEEQEKYRLVWVAPTPIVAILDLETYRWYLCEDGNLVRQDSTVQTFTLPIARGQALLALKENEPLLVIGDNRDVLWFDRQSLEISREISLSSAADAVALNPYKTMLAWLNIFEKTVKVLILESGKEFTLVSGLDLSPALSFSVDGRYLALGSSRGDILLVDFATRKVAQTFSLAEISSYPSAVRALFGRKRGGWVSVYKDRRVVLWSAEGKVEKTIRSQRRILALDYHSKTGLLALGLSDGVLRVVDDELNKIFEDAVQKKEISFLCFSQSGRQIFTIGGKTEVRRVDL